MNPAILAVLVAFALLPSIANAVPITFIHTGVGSGTLNGVPFADADFTITSTGDTNNRNAPFPAFTIEHSASSIAISEVGIFAFLTPTRTFVNSVITIADFSRGPHSADLVYGPSDPAFAVWDMLRSIGPVTGTGTILQWELDPPMQTDGGELVFRDSLGASATFQAIVPEPSNCVLAAIGVVVLIAARRVRR
jgi:hypothetical protein